eukprot:TRINITY_DN882_c0_g2_i1.p1 TRINITY_DN882_c0_g2~~TRINITY_DN882_c0_g2_i1.p1  ORF type:complete len:210 (+),score=107.47 TRINITY_DN882_c0_g2_i1:52-681(+)
MNVVRNSVLSRCARSFSIAPLPYDYDALRPVLSAETLQFHYDKHHTGYYNKLLAFAEKERPDLIEKSNEEIIKTETGFVFNQAAQIFNHDFYWQSMSPNGGGEPTGALANKINEDFGSFAEFKKAFQAQVEGHFGSGWVWLVQDKTTKKLSVVNTHDAGCPITDDNVKPLMTCDAWEHAFYIDYRNAKPEYATNFWNIVNWEFAASNLQ